MLAVLLLHSTQCPLEIIWGNLIFPAYVLILTLHNWESATCGQCYLELPLTIDKHINRNLQIKLTIIRRQGQQEGDQASWVCPELSSVWDTECSVPRPGKRANQGALFTLSHGAWLRFVCYCISGALNCPGIKSSCSNYIHCMNESILTQKQPYFCTFMAYIFSFPVFFSFYTMFTASNF